MADVKPVIQRVWFQRPHRCILNVSVGGWFPEGQVRLEKSLRKFERMADIVKWKDSYPPESPTHQERPYAFKAFAFEWAREAGYTSCLWLDSSMIVRKPIDGMWRKIEKVGYLFVMDGKSCAWSISDRGLKGMGMTRDEIAPYPGVFGGCIGMNLKSQKANDFLKKWMSWVTDSEINHHCEDRYNKNGVHSDDPRCEMHLGEQVSVGVIRKQMDLETTPYGKYLAFDGAMPDPAIVIRHGL